ncbi:hypothetical protein BYT27DRAFT_7153875 [Phlegmacium glaucopus]|nr:hypothetical protein BYT27DRAFT_7153875 [Phlegmacium glaucopus]
MANPKAQAAKDDGNIAFKSGDYPTAIGHYTTAILADKSDITYPLNRAAAYLKLGKNEDAERDCTRVLELSSDNVKALFRRSQARIGMGNITEAHKDLLKVLQIEPSNQSAQEELKKVASLIEKSMKSNKAPISPLQSSLDPSLTNKRRRVPIKIIEPPSKAASTTSSAVPVPGPPKPQETHVLESSSQAVPPASNPKTDTLEPVSSRSLKLSATVSSSGKASQDTDNDKNAPSRPKTSPSADSHVPSPPNPTPSPPANPTNGTFKPNSFKDAKHARESAKPSRVGGGIFRASGSNTIFAPRENGNPTSADPPKSDSSTSSLSTGLSAEDDYKTAYTPAPKAPNTLFDFVKSWGSLRSVEEKWQLINSISPNHFPALCKTSLEPSMLVSIIENFLSILDVKDGDAQVKTVIREYMENFARIPRFNTLVLFLSKSEKVLAKNVLTAVGVDQPTGMWGGVV